MPKLVLPYEAEVRPWRLNQEWGRLDPATYGQFGFTRHNGQDVPHGTRSEIRAPFDFEVTQVLWQPNGGGHVIGIVSQERFDGPKGAQCYVQIDFMHNAKNLLAPGYKGKAGEIVAIAGNSGFSTGPHCHIRHKWMKRSGTRLVDVEKNDAQNSFDPTPYRNGKYAADLVPALGLVLGAENGAVASAQTVLKQLGYFPAKQAVTGYWGSISEKAHQDFINSTGLKLDIDRSA